LNKDAETALDVSAYAAHMAALLGAHIIKVKLPTDHLAQNDAKKVYEKQKVDISTMAARVAHICQAAFANKRLVVFSGGAAKDETSVYEDARAILAGGGHGSIIGRNSFQRPRNDALALLSKICAIYLGKNV
jgi:class I fructose-bisphosphate aldolase